MTIDQRELCQENAENCILALDAIYTSVPRNKALGLLGDFNDIALFLATCREKFPVSATKSDSANPEGVNRMQKYCKECGTLNDYGASKCVKCGAPI